MNIKNNIYWIAIITVQIHCMMHAAAHESVTSSHISSKPLQTTQSLHKNQSWIEWLGFQSPAQPKDISLQARQIEKKEENMQRAAARKIERAYTQELSLPNIDQDIARFSSFDTSGYPTNQEIKNLVKHNFFSNNPRQEVQITTIPGGSFSDKIYSASILSKDADGSILNSTPVFFLKISSKPESHNRLISTQQSSVGRLGINKKYKDADGNIIPIDQLPVMTWVEKIFKYTDPQGNQRFIEVTHPAKGTSLYNLIFQRNDDLIANSSLFTEQEYKSAGSNNIRLANFALTSMGKSLGYFQQAFMTYPDSQKPQTWKTVAHNDLNLNNVFYDPKQSKISFIDNETMQEHQPIVTDVNNFLAFINNVIEYKIKKDTFFVNIDNAQDVSYNYSIWFLQGYLESFPADKRDHLVKLLQEQLQDTTLHTTPLNIYYSSQTKSMILDFLNKRYVDINM
jgi:hypothetical protein